MPKKNKSRLLVYIFSLVAFLLFSSWDYVMGNSVPESRSTALLLGFFSYSLAFFIWWMTAINALYVFVASALFLAFFSTYAPTMLPAMALSVAFPLVSILFILSFFRFLFRKKLTFSENFFERN